ncbi:hypothetical protein [Candidatus Venteria ishoeyi]|uniref:Uncharacterized protein n=1 Tax=Candidatus Venteria ishoeyi TaxID=1899563 RepID=A0A1H6F5H6_9GAMM|nr:hypothetical protein [Candidatus Venteria ishoeyi]SEH05352.1 Uncharacterised protein [Candidatus Venteria ishoeyi]
MPVNTIQESKSNKKWYKLNKKKTYTKTWRGKEIEETAPCFTQWDKEDKEEKYISNSFGGRLTDITLEEPKQLKKADGTAFSIQNLTLKFNTIQDGEELEEIISFYYLDKFSKTLISKLLRVRDYSEINILVGRITNVDDDGNKKPNDFIAVYGGIGVKENGLKNVIYQEYPVKKGETKKELPDDAVLIPKKRYLKEDEKKGGYTITTSYEDAEKDQNGYAMLDKKWEAEEKEIYTNSITAIKESIANWRDENPLEIPTQTQTVATEDIVDDEPSAPEVNVDEVNTQMPILI